jgi:hypothetical protein
MKQLLLVLLIFSAGCIQDIDLEIPDHTPGLAIAALASDSLISVHVTSSAAISDFPRIDGCKIKLWTKQGPEFLITQDSLPGLYTLAKDFLPKEEYYIEVEKEGFPSVTASTRSPDKIKIKTVEVTQAEVVDTLWNINFASTYFIDAEFEIPESDSYSGIILRAKVLQEDDEGRKFTINAGDIQFARNIPFDYNYLAEGIMIQKEGVALMEGAFNLKFSTFSGLYPKPSDKVSLEIIALSTEYEDFLRAAIDQQNSDLEVLFSDPVRLNSNVKDGYGFFGAIQSDSLHMVIR